MTLSETVKQIEAAVDLPPGYSISGIDDSQSIMVSNGQLAFAVGKDWPDIVGHVQKMLPELIHQTNNLPEVTCIRP